MTWVIVDSDGNESESINSEQKAETQKRSMEQLGKDVELKEIDDEDDGLDYGSGIDAEVIEVSGGDGGNENGPNDDDGAEDELTIVGDGGRPYTFCRNCDRLSACTYRCAGCGADLAGEPHYDGVLP